jgi:hypothetical protein
LHELLSSKAELRWRLNSRKTLVSFSLDLHGRLFHVLVPSEAPRLLRRDDRT